MPRPPPCRPQSSCTLAPLFEQKAPTGVLTVCTKELPMNILCKTLLIAAGAATATVGT
jgi:hypothetical protein